MKKLVTEIDKAAFIKILPYFGIDSQITILEDTEISCNPSESSFTKKPFYIDENIVDLDSVLSLCTEADGCIKSPIRKNNNSEDFLDFWELVLNIQKQREFGAPISNIEYIYRKGLQLNLPISLQMASADMGFSPEADYFVITGKSELGEMLLYQDDAYNFLEYVFELQYYRIKKLTKKKVRKNSHWHPRGYQMAIEDTIAFMNNDKEYFKKRKLF